MRMNREARLVTESMLDPATGFALPLGPVRIVDSHTAGEPTRMVVDGGPELGDGSLAQRRELLCGRYDFFRSAVINEPRGSDVLVGALLTRPVDPSCVAGVIFFNNVGGIGMCGHGAIGVIATLAHLGRIAPGCHRLETPVGVVSCEYVGAGSVAIENVASYRHAAGVAVDVEGFGRLSGDIAWGGNWFFLTDDHRQRLELDRAGQLTDFAHRIRQALQRDGIHGAGGEEIDHIELFGPPRIPANQSCNFVLCPGGAYDRSPCGTGTSAKLACLAADGKLQPGELWRQEGILGTVFEGSYRRTGETVIPTIRGSAFVTAEGTLLFDPADPFRVGIRSKFAAT
jgi:4-hydroxyproline epimerase